jgi:hypothetical protein
LPDNPQQVIATALELKRPIYIIYIGDDPEGKAFMEKLARLTGGSANFVNINNSKMLSSSIKEEIKRITR